MTDNAIYRDISTRTGGDIYIGVVGPVRSGKSTFIQKMLEGLVLPGISDENERARAVDSTPQSASGRTVMTTEPKFIPDEAVRVKMDDGTELNMKLIDCVGYLVDGALGTEEGGEARMVMTPWSEEPMPFTEAAELGTHKVISEHSTIAILVSCDGSFGEIPRESYIPAEERVARELKEAGKPFAILLNSKAPESEKTQRLALELEEKYSAPVALVDCLNLSGVDIAEILKLVLSEFPISTLNFKLPDWCALLPEGHSLYNAMIEKIEAFSDSVRTLGDVERQVGAFDGIVTASLSARDGVGELEMPVAREVFYEAISDVTGLEVRDDGELFAVMMRLGEVDKSYARIEKALLDATEKGYGIVMPSASELVLEEPKITKQAGGWGVKIGAHADSIHLIKAGIRTEICPVVGTEEQSEQVLRYLGDEIAGGDGSVWQSNIFGRSLYELVNDGLCAKLGNIPEDSREKLSETLEKIVNTGANGLVCILL